MEPIFGLAAAATNDFDQVAEEIKRNHVVALVRLSAGERGELSKAIERWKTQNRIAYVLLLKRGDPLRPWRRLWPVLGLKLQFDLLILYNGIRWEARGWGLSTEKIGVALNAAEPKLKISPAKGIAAALHLLAKHSLRSPIAGRRTSIGRSRGGDDGATANWWIAFGAGGVVIVGLIAFAIMRRMRRAKENRQAFEEACDAAKERYGEVMLATDGLQASQIAELQLRAAAHMDELDSLVEQVDSGNKHPSDPVVLGKVRQIENEFTTVRSAILRKQQLEGL